VIRLIDLLNAFRTHPFLKDRMVLKGGTALNLFVFDLPRLSVDAEIAPGKYTSFEALGICTIDAGTETQLADLGGLYRALGKTVYAVCDKPSTEDEAAINAQVDELFMHSEKGIEDLVLKNTTTGALERFTALLAWPPHLLHKNPDPKADVVNAVGDYFDWAKANWGIADFLVRCNEDEIPRIQTLLDVANSHADVIKGNPQLSDPYVLFLAFADSSLNFELRAIIRNVDRRLQVISDMNRAIDATIGYAQLAEGINWVPWREARF